MTTEELSKEEMEVLKDFREHMPRSNDLTSHVLFGHLLIERYMDKALSKLLRNPKPVTNARFTFAQKVAVIESFDAAPPAPHWSVLKIFNKLRNELVHNLPRDRMLAILQDFEGEFKHHFKDRPTPFDEEHIVLIVDQFALIAIGGLSTLVEKYTLAHDPANSHISASDTSSSIN